MAAVMEFLRNFWRYRVTEFQRRSTK